MTNLNHKPDDVLLIAYFRNSGQVFSVRTRPEFARTALEEWKKFTLFYLKAEFERDESEKPFVLYHFRDENGTMASLLFTDVSAMQFLPIAHECVKTDGAVAQGTAVS